jgi:hypothetical protein
LKKLIITEGDNDRVFCRHFLSRSANIQDDEIEVFSLTGEAGGFKWTESRAIRDFLGSWSPRIVLIKVENGKENVFKLFRICIGNILMSLTDLDAIVIFDHDGNDPEDELEKLLQETKQTTKNIDFKKVDRKSFLSSRILLRKYDILKRSGDKSTKLSSCSFLTFCSSLEKAAGVDKVNDRKEERQRKICALAESLIDTELRQFLN